VTLDAGGQQTGVKRYYAIGGQPIALRDAGGTVYLLTDHLGSVVTVIDASGAVVGEQRYRPFGQPRLTPGITQTDRGFTGQQSLSAAGLVDFNARWFDTSLGAFASPDSLVQYAYSPQSLNRYSYVLNNPLTYSDPTGHRACEGPMGECWYTDPVEGRMPVRGWEPTVGSQQVPPTPPQTDACINDTTCTDAYRTYTALTDLIGRLPTLSELVYMTAAREYWEYVDFQLLQRAGNWTARSAGQEALARNIYNACGGDGYCTPDELYRFLSGFQPWFGDPVDRDPQLQIEWRASELHAALSESFAGTAGQLRSDVSEILGPEAVAQGWVTGLEAGRPWQWFGPHEDMNHPALVTLALGEAQYFMMFTNNQDWQFKAVHP